MALTTPHDARPAAVHGATEARARGLHVVRDGEWQVPGAWRGLAGGHREPHAGDRPVLEVPAVALDRPVRGGPQRSGVARPARRYRPARHAHRPGDRGARHRRVARGVGRAHVDVVVLRGVIPVAPGYGRGARGHGVEGLGDRRADPIGTLGGVRLVGDPRPPERARRARGERAQADGRASAVRDRREGAVVRVGRHGQRQAERQ